jgi:hypothetical protein
MDAANPQRDVVRGQRLKRPLGQLLLDGEFISHHALERALLEQEKTNELLGGVLVRLGLLDPVDLSAALSVQGELTSVRDAIRAAAGVRKLLGELLLEARRITPEVLDRALAEQRRTGEKIGEVLVRQGVLAKEELAAVLDFQRHLGGEAPTSSRLRLGEILVATGQITREQLDRALVRQKITRKKIGEILVEDGDITPRQVARGLTIQKKLVTAALLATLAMATPAVAQPAAPSTAKLTVSATVLARSDLRILHQPPVLVVTNADIARGYVEVSDASRIEVRSNNRGGFLLVFEGLESPEPLIERVTVRGLASELEIGPGGGWVPQPFRDGPSRMELRYRFTLHKNARPGTYAWPLSISIRPF